MEAITTSRIRVAAQWLRPWVALRPYTGNLALDVVFLLIVGALHHTILPGITGGLVLIDLMTPWLVVTFVAAPLPRGVFLGFLGALILEAHSAAPAGLYFCAYWVAAVAIRLTRETLSWRHIFPWLMTFLGVEIWIVVFETFVVTVGEGGVLFGFSYVFTQFIRILLACGFGLFLCRRAMELGVGEEAG